MLLITLHLRDIHAELETGLELEASQLGEVARWQRSWKKQIEPLLIIRYYFDGTGKAVRPVIAVCLGKAALETTGCSTNSEVGFKTFRGRGEGKGDRKREDKTKLQVEGKQRQVALVSEMIHTASLLHDDILDHAHTRRGKPSVNSNWDARKSTFAGNRAMIIMS